MTAYEAYKEWCKYYTAYISEFCRRINRCSRAIEEVINETEVRELERLMERKTIEEEFLKNAVANQPQIPSLQT
ncbi:MAG: hypothetical protein A4E65_02137 [Syntrophorhabdus sp. PtaU1.Bin153]|nr:MAG: hypothetical protein A4E65_02137 [Syntrophorhabdus sp. PtaU1.Bin153]